MLGVKPPHFESIETPRLRLRRMRADDIPAFLAYRNDPDVARYQSWSSTDEATSLRFIAELETLEPGMRNEWFQFAIARREDDVLLGDCGLLTTPDSPPQGMVGYTLAREHQRRGYATEAVTALLDYAFGPLALHRITATVDPRNGPSIALLERLGLRREGHFLCNAFIKGEWCDEYLYALLASEWRAKQTAGL